MKKVAVRHFSEIISFLALLCSRSPECQMSIYNIQSEHSTSKPQLTGLGDQPEQQTAVSTVTNLIYTSATTAAGGNSRDPNTRRLLDHVLFLSSEPQLY